jgi:spermidine/putrescine-binding protein
MSKDKDVSWNDFLNSQESQRRVAELRRPFLLRTSSLMAMVYGPQESLREMITGRDLVERTARDPGGPRVIIIPDCDRIPR